MVYILKIKDKFDAAHRIMGVDKKCENMHGHTFHIEVEFRYDRLNENGVCEDFGILKELVGRVVKRLDHSYLNDILEQPTSERLAEMIYKLIKEWNNAIYKVTVWETERAGVEYCED